MIYEGKGPAGSQFIIKCLTDNRNRTAATIRHLFSRVGGSLAPVMWNFTPRGVIQIASESLKDKITDWDDLELQLIDQGAEDIFKEDEGITIYTRPEDLQKVKTFLEGLSINTEVAELQQIAKEKIIINDAADKEKLENFIELLEECEDVSDYYTNIEWD